MIDRLQAWVFDLDNTLYPSQSNLFAQVDQRMTAFVADFLKIDTEEARRVQKRYYADYGTTLSGLMQVHDMKPDLFLDYVHDIDLSPINACTDLRAAIEVLPGRRFVFTNGSLGHAERVLKARGLEGLFEDIAHIASVAFTPKPHAPAYDRMLDQFALKPRGAAFFEDMVRNLEVPKALGFETVLIRSDFDWSDEPEGARPAHPDHSVPAYVDHVTDDLTVFLTGLAQPGEAAHKT
jgi:putative hydrolase of the HAD superfamily